MISELRINTQRRGHASARCKPYRDAGCSPPGLLCIPPIVAYLLLRPYPCTTSLDYYRDLL